MHKTSLKSSDKCAKLHAHKTHANSIHSFSVCVCVCVCVCSLAPLWKEYPYGMYPDQRSMLVLLCPLPTTLHHTARCFPWFALLPPRNTFHFLLSFDNPTKQHSLRTVQSRRRKKGKGKKGKGGDEVGEEEEGWLLC